jgi:hypothetical protein
MDGWESIGVSRAEYDASPELQRFIEVVANQPLPRVRFPSFAADLIGAEHLRALECMRVDWLFELSERRRA